MTDLHIEYTVKQVNFAGTVFLELEIVAIFAGTKFCKNGKLIVTVNGNLILQILRFCKIN